MLIPTFVAKTTQNQSVYHTKIPKSTFEFFCKPHLAWADFRIKVKRIAHSIVHFDQWNKLISKMLSLKIFIFWPRWPRKRPLNLSSFGGRPLDYNLNGILHFWNQFVPLIKMHYTVRYSLDFDPKIRSGQVCCPQKGVWVSSRKNAKARILHPPRRNANYEYIQRAIFRDSWFTMHTIESPHPQVCACGRMHAH